MSVEAVANATGVNDKVAVATLDAARVAFSAGTTASPYLAVAVMVFMLVFVGIRVVMTRTKNVRES